MDGIIEGLNSLKKKRKKFKNLPLLDQARRLIEIARQDPVIQYPMKYPKPYYHGKEDRKN